MAAKSAQPTHEQAQLHLQVFEMRREARLRQARDWFNQNYWAENMQDAMRIAAPGTEAGTNLMMVLGYWDQACALLNYGLLHEELFFTTSGEFYGVWERMKATIAEARQMFHNPLFLSNLEKAATRFESWMSTQAPGALEAMRQMMKQMRGQAVKTA